MAAVLLILPGFALAQTRSLVVPPGAAVVIAPRGQTAPRPTLAPPTAAQRRFVAKASTGETLSGPSVAVAAGLAAAAGLAVMLGGGGGGGSAASAAPSRTR